MSVPVTMGSPRFQAVTTPGCVVTEAWFPPGAALEPHTHERTIFAVMLEGSFDTAIAGRRLECVPNTVWTEPREERHANYVGPAGARVLVVQPDPARQEMFGVFGSLLEEVNCLADPVVVLEARQVVAEMGLEDSVSAAAIDALALGMMVRADRRFRTGRRESGPPPWLRRVRELVHERFRTGFDLAELARIADVTPSHLCQSFRRHFHTTIGEYARRLRVLWTAERLAGSDEPIASIAAAGGYADQSHLTREFNRAFGLNPAEYRRSRRR